MDFLEKLDSLINRDKLNKSTLSKACDIPYTTIDDWYKKGYRGLKLTTLRKLANFFGTTLDFWANDPPFDDMIKEYKEIHPSSNFTKEEELIKKYRALDDRGKQLVNAVLESQFQFIEKPEIKDAAI